MNRSSKNTEAGSQKIEVEIVKIFITRNTKVDTKANKGFVADASIWGGN